VLVIDAHGHIDYIQKFGPRNSADGLIKEMDALGIGTMAISAGASLDADSKLGNQIVADAMERYPGRFIGVGCINPNYPEAIDEDIRFCFYESGMNMVKPYGARHEYPLDGPRNRRILDCADRLRLPALCGIRELGLGEREPETLARLSLEYQGVRFIMGHSGSRYPIAREYAELARRRDNVFLEITYTTITYGIIKHLVDEVGDEKVLYGSDAGFRDIAPQLGWVIYAKISEESKRKILGLNMKRILDDVKEP